MFVEEEGKATISYVLYSSCDPFLSGVMVPKNFLLIFSNECEFINGLFLCCFFGAFYAFFGLFGGIMKNHSISVKKING